MRAIFWAGVLPLSWSAADLLNRFAFAALLLYPAQIFRMALRRGVAQTGSWKFAIFMMLAKFAEMQGIARYWWLRSSGENPALLDYKDPDLPRRQAPRSQGPMSKVAVIIVNYRTGELVIENLAAIASERETLTHSVVVYVVDNNSGDDSVSLISDAIERSGWTKWARLRAHPRNDGFSAGNNVALHEILRSGQKYDYVYLLNPDATIRPGAIRVLTDFLDERPEVAIVGSCLQEPDGTLSRSAFRFPSPVGEFLRGAGVGILDKLLHRWVIAPLPKDHPHKTDWVSGASCMVRRTVFEQIGLLDEGYFLYFDEVDFMKSAAKAKLEVWHNPNARVIHVAGSATKIKNSRSEYGGLPPYWYDSWRRYFVKHHGRFGAFLAGSGWLTGHLLHSLKRAIRTESHKSGGPSATEFITRGLLPALGNGLNRTGEKAN